MDKMVLRIFQREVQKQCEFALTSTMYINDFFKNDSSAHNNQLWYFVQNFLISTANVSKLLWGSKSTIAMRQVLRESLGVDEDSPLKIRDFRNHFEHYDERVERWASSSTNRNFIDSNIGPIRAFGNAFNQEDFFRNFDPELMAITFQGQTYELQPIVDELAKLHDIAKFEGDKPHWE
ncbi:hypothetical protein M3172_08705 [Mesobacillus subterraneus]|uniref:hypothetical protein n=1 Tax=Mesobacillus subterraneus TaxID=285983 RepID=UPI00203C7E59|nr:hypothetical protein [Mesobacillus subterraneus]MCM3573273.1 hypothetical protein [Mesobacillus subterraneus]